MIRFKLLIFDRNRTKWCCVLIASFQVVLDSDITISGWCSLWSLTGKLLIFLLHFEAKKFFAKPFKKDIALLTRIFKVSNLRSFNICIQRETVTTIKIINIPIIPKSFLLSFCNLALSYFPESFLFLGKHWSILFYYYEVRCIF